MKRLAHYSQYFLRSPVLVKTLIGHTTIRKQDTVLDIGAGSGVITSALASRCHRVIAIEAEPRIAATLRANVQARKNVEVRQGDFLAMPLPKEPYKIFANIPFHLSAPIVRRITQADTPPQATYLIVQKQFANKLRADSLHFTSQLGMCIGPWFSVRIRGRLKRTDFWPHPNVDTVLLELIPREVPLLPIKSRSTYTQFTTDIFSSPKQYEKLPNVNRSLKPSQYNLEQWVALFKESSLNRTSNSQRSVKIKEKRLKSS